MAIKASVIIPAHNASEFIANAVRSALDQTLREIEIIVIDDASGDDTVAVAMAAGRSDPRLILLRRETNGGPGAARNLGLECATGDWIALLDADDTFAAQRLEFMVQGAERRRADLFADNIVITRAPNSKAGATALSKDFMSQTGSISAADFVAADRPSHGTGAVGFLKPIMRAGFLRKKQIRYDPRLRNGEDFHLYVRALLHGGELFVTADAWYRYLFRTESQCRGTEAKFPQQLIDSNEELLRIALEAGHKAAADELRERRSEMDHWIPYSSFVAELKNRQRVRAVKSFCMLPSRSYALRKLGEAGLRRIRRIPEVSLTAG